MLIANKLRLGFHMMVAKERETTEIEIENRGRVKQRSENGESTLRRQKWHEKGAWSEEEDSKLRDYIERYGHWNWRELPKFAGLARCGKSCRLRWMNYLRPSVKRGNFSKEEEDVIIKFHQKIGNKWSAIAAQLPGRSDNEIKNHWHTHLKKRSTKQNPEAVHQVKEAQKLNIRRIINFSALLPSVLSISSDNIVSHESTASHILLSHESTASHRVSDDTTSGTCIQHRLLFDLNQEYVDSREEDSNLKEELECS